MRSGLWDLAGVDGLAVARELFGEDIARMSVWQSWDSDGVSVLRLCEGNFRVRIADATALQEAAQGRRVWVKPCRMAVLIARDDADALLPVATVKPPHRLAGLPMGRAVPCRLDDRAVLLWRHAVAGVASLEVLTALADGAAVQETLCRKGLL